MSSRSRPTIPEARYRRAGRALIARFAVGVSLATIATSGFAAPIATVDRNGSLVSVEAYAPNIVRVTIATDRGQVDAPGRRSQRQAQCRGLDAPQRRRRRYLHVRRAVAFGRCQALAQGPHADGTLFRAIAAAGVGDDPQARRHDADADDRVGDGAAYRQRRKDVPRRCKLRLPADEHYYGLGQNQEGKLDLRGRTIDCRHNYDAPAGETVCVPFMVTNKGYGIVWDNPSSTVVSPASTVRRTGGRKSASASRSSSSRARPPTRSMPATPR
ncbi:hypothetical protein [Sphingomonas aerolata]|uniref:hypothetical protein n=1 Tax=Sphingomonas aerolata TaxID=185951 RepID=UPI003A5C345E